MTWHLNNTKWEFAVIQNYIFLKSLDIAVLGYDVLLYRSACQPPTTFSSFYWTFMSLMIPMLLRRKIINATLMLSYGGVFPWLVGYICPQFGECWTYLHLSMLLLLSTLHLILYFPWVPFKYISISSGSKTLKGSTNKRIINVHLIIYLSYQLPKVWNQ